MQRETLLCCDRILNLYKRKESKKRDIFTFEKWQDIIKCMPLVADFGSYN